MSETTAASPSVSPAARVTKRWWWWRASLRLGLILAVIAFAAVYFLHQPQYEAAALLEVFDPQYIAFAPSESASPKDYLRTQVEVIRSKWIANRTLASEKIKDLSEVLKQRDPLQWLSERLSVVTFNDSNLFEIKFICGNPENASLIVNEITRQYLTAIEDEKSSRFRTMLSTLNQQLRSREDNVRMLRRQVEEAEQRASADGIELEPPDPKPTGESPLSELKARFVYSEADRVVQAARVTAWEEEIRAAEGAAGAPEKATAPPPREISIQALTADEVELRNELVDRELNSISEVKQLDAQLLVQQMSLDRLEKNSKTGKNDPLYKQKQDEIAASEKSLEDLKTKFRPRIEKRMDSMFRNNRRLAANELPGDEALLARWRDELTRARVELRSCEIAQEKLKSDHSAQLSNAVKNREQSSGERLALIFKRNELTSAQAVLARISDRTIELQVERSAPSRVIWHSPAEVPRSPIESHVFRTMSMAVAAGFCLPYLLGFIALIIWNISLLIAKLEPKST
jgi:uncharacterized protein involved in exopolysaccharide biosynthesis